MRRITPWLLQHRLILDEWLLVNLTETEARDLLEIILPIIIKPLLYFVHSLHH